VLPKPNAVWLFLAIKWRNICHWVEVNIRWTARRFYDDLRGRSYGDAKDKGLRFAIRRFLNYRRLRRIWRIKDKIRRIEELRKKETDEKKQGAPGAAGGRSGWQDGKSGGEVRQRIGMVDPEGKIGWM
jgi:hypothetical protein